jgi:hypothetical protein
MPETYPCILFHYELMKVEDNGKCGTRRGDIVSYYMPYELIKLHYRLAKSVKHETLNVRIKGSSSALGTKFSKCNFITS